MINNSLIIFSLLISGLLLLLLDFIPTLDLVSSGIFYNFDKNVFTYKQNIIVKFFYLTIPAITKVFIIILVIYLIYLVIKHKNIKNLYQSPACYLLFAALLGPGLTVNSILKNYHGRARPAQVVEFGGNQIFSAPFASANYCQTNCAFPSGHASMAFYFSALAYVLALKRREFNKIYVLGLLFGIFVGWSRIAMGGHFLSDVAASCFITLLANHLTYLLWKKYA